MSYVPPVYHENAAVRSMHNFPRFGYSDQVSSLFSRNDNDVKDYSYGIIIIAAIFFSIFLSWFTILLFFCCLGPNSVGFLSGSRMQVLKSPNVAQKTCKRPIWVRSIFILSSIIILAFSIVIAIQGTSNGQDFIDTSRKHLKDVSSLVDKGKNLTETVRSVGNAVEPIRAHVADILENDLCPGGNLNNIQQDLRSQVAAVQDILTSLRGFIGGQLQNLENELDRARKIVDDADYNFEKYTPDIWMYLAYPIPLCCLCLLLSYGVILAWYRATNKKAERLMSWVVMPLFILLIFLGCIACGSVTVGSVVVADTCSGNSTHATPDNTVLQIINYQDWKRDSLVYKGFVYYVDRCQSFFPFAFLPTYLDKLHQANKKLGNLYQNLEPLVRSNVAETECPTTDFDEILNSTSVLQYATAVLSNSTMDVISLLECQNLNSLYSHIAHETVCKTASDISFYLFVYTLIIATFGLIMITLRSAYLEVEDSDDNMVRISVIDIPSDEEKLSHVTQESISSQDMVRQVTSEPLNDEEIDAEVPKDPNKEGNDDEIAIGHISESTRSWEELPVKVTPSLGNVSNAIDIDTPDKEIESLKAPDSSRSWEKYPIKDTPPNHFNFKQY